MTLAGDTGKVLAKAQARLDSGLLPSDSEELLRLADLVTHDVSAEAEALYTAWRAARPAPDGA